MCFRSKNYDMNWEPSRPVPYQPARDPSTKRLDYYPQRISIDDHVNSPSRPSELSSSQPPSYRTGQSWSAPSSSPPRAVPSPPVYNPAPTQTAAAGHCFTCANRAPNRLQTVTNDGSNPNRNRRYRKCTNNVCGAFNGFADDRGVNPGNPDCRCNITSRLVAKNQRNRDTGLWELFFSCQDKGCKFYSPYTTESGIVGEFTDADINTLIERGVI